MGVIRCFSVCTMLRRAVLHGGVRVRIVTVSKGIFSTLLGDVTAFDLSIFNGQDLWLGINVGADPQMSPRQPLAYVPYAIHADDAGTVDGMDASDFAAQEITATLCCHGRSVIYLNIRDYNQDLTMWITLCGMKRYCVGKSP